jgi:SAM-dependent methyltransferase
MDAQAPDTSLPRQIAPGYLRVERLRRGADSTIYRAVREEDERDVVLKVLHDESCPIEEHAAQLRELPPHPAVVPVLRRAYAEAFAEDGARVTVFDLPEVIELMKEHLDAAGISAVGGDFNEGLPEGPFDAAYLGNVSHIYGPEENLALMKRVAGSLSPGGLIAIRDFVRGLSKGATLFAVNMLVNTESGDTYTLLAVLPHDDAYEWARRRRASVNAATGRIELESPTAHPHVSVGLPNGTTMHPEVLNLTRNVRIHGSGDGGADPASNGRAHIWIGSDQPQIIRFAELRHLGPRRHAGDHTEGVLGRYPLHFHMMGDGSRGSIVEGVVVADSGNRAFVPHG